MRTLAVVAPSCQLSLRGRLGRHRRCTGVVRLPHLRVMGVWRERLRDGILRGGPHLPVDGGATPGGPWRFLVREWTRLRRSSRLLRAVSVALLFLVIAVR